MSNQSWEKCDMSPSGHWCDYFANTSWFKINATEHYYYPPPPPPPPPPLLPLILPLLLPLLFVQPLLPCDAVVRWSIVQAITWTDADLLRRKCIWKWHLWKCCLSCWGVITSSSPVCGLFPMITDIIRQWTTASEWAFYQIRKIAGCACDANAGNVFPVTTDPKGNRQLAILVCITTRASRTCRDACRDR